MGRKFKERAKIRRNGQGVGPPWMAKTKWAVSRDQSPQSSPLLSTLIRSHLKWRGVATEDCKLRGCLLSPKRLEQGQWSPEPAPSSALPQTARLIALC